MGTFYKLKYTQLLEYFIHRSLQHTHKHANDINKLFMLGYAGSCVKFPVHNNNKNRY